MSSQNRRCSRLIPRFIVRRRMIIQHGLFTEQSLGSLIAEMKCINCGKEISEEEVGAIVNKRVLCKGCSKWLRELGI